MYGRSIPVLVHNIEALARILAKAEAHCGQHKIDKAYLLQARLFPDMFPLVRQVQLVTDYAKGCGARLTQQAVPSYPDTESSFPELQARLRKTVEFLKSLNTDAFQGAGAREVSLKAGGRDITMSGEDYIAYYVLPNFYFHMATAYNILRHNGVELGKGDFLGRS